MPVQIDIGDVVRMRKPHPCGGYEWTVVRLGADIGIKCNTCARRVLLPRRDFEKRLKTIVRRATQSSEPSSSSPVPSDL
jgi:hypothetical protein